MNLSTVLALLLTVTALLAFLNHRFLRLPGTIGVMAAALGGSLLLLGAAALGLGHVRWARELLEQIAFDELLMRGMLSFLLFAGALHVELEALWSRRWTVLALATVGVAASAALIALGFGAIAALLGLGLGWLHAWLFGVLLSPTDPIAVLGVFKRSRVDPRLEAIFAGESLFNDGVAVVLFLVLLGMAGGGHEVSWTGALRLFAVEALGGIALGLALGYAGFWLLKQVDQYVVEILITLALVAGGYELAVRLHTSGPLAMVVAGLFTGNRGRLLAMSERTRRHLDDFWELVDEILNAVLFVLIGLEALVLELRPVYLAAGAAAIPLVLAARALSVALPVTVLRRWRPLPRHLVKVLVWGGLRGGISIALALSLPPSRERDLLVVATYVAVVFSILVQGLTIGRVLRRLAGPARAAAET